MSKDYRIEVKVNAVRVRLPVYRIWINDELMCERTFWPNPTEFFINETMIVDLKQASENVLKFELVDPALGKVWMEHVKITDIELDWQCQEHKITQLRSTTQELKFTI